MNILEAMISLQNSIPDDKSQNQMIRTILDHLDTVKNSTIYEVAALCDTSTTSVGRLCGSLGYDSYFSFRSSLADTLDNYVFYNHLLPVSFEKDTESIREEIICTAARQAEALEGITTDSLSEAAKILHSVKNVHFFSHFPTPMLFLSLQQNLIMDGRQSYYHALKRHEDKALKMLDSGSAALFIIPDLHRENPLLDTFRATVAAGAKTIVFYTRPKPYWREATLQIYLPGSSSLLDSHLSEHFLEMLSCVYRSKYIQK